MVRFQALRNNAKAPRSGYKQIEANGLPRIEVLLADVKSILFICNRTVLSKLFAC